jgi:hypothetical protein
MSVSVRILAFVTQHSNRVSSALYYIAKCDMLGSIKFFHFVS